jgi:hypothetical protein
VKEREKNYPMIVGGNSGITQVFLSSLTQIRKRLLKIKVEISRKKEGKGEGREKRKEMERGRKKEEEGDGKRKERRVKGVTCFQ